MNRKLAVAVLGVSTSIVVGCGGNSPTEVDETPTAPAAGMLRLASAAELEASLKSGFTAVRTGADAAVSALAGGAAASAPPSPAPTAPNTFTGTYTQELDVDELDAVRYDGTHLYVAPQRVMSCCFIMGIMPAGAPPPAPPQRSIRILATDPVTASATEVSEIPLADGVSVQGMYLASGAMFALTSEVFYGSYGALWADAAIWAPQKFGFRVYDTRNAASPVLRHEASIDGVFVESRRVGDTVYIVSRHTPSVQGLEYHVRTAAHEAHNMSVLRDVTLTQLLPSITINGVKRSLVDPARCYVATDSNARGGAIVTSITAVPIADPSAFRTTCYNEDAYGAYVSATSLYFTEIPSHPNATRAFTRIHKFALQSLSYEGSAEIPGQVWRGGQADFRMSEHGGDLRVFASEFDWTDDDFVDHSLYVLRKSSSELRLDIAAQLPNDRRPEEIGKTDEQLFGVRFFGDRAYAVTFRQIDPLYVIDLANPADPYLAGRLEVAGVSDFLHPVSGDLLLGLGVAETGSIKLELFDVSDIDRPLSRGSATLGGRGSYSEARHDRHAFTYQADVGGVDRFTIPATLYEQTGSFVESGLYLYEIRDKGTPRLATLNAAGALVVERGAQTTFGSFNRAFIHGNTIYYVRGDEVWSAFWSTPFAPNGAF